MSVFLQDDLEKAQRELADARSHADLWERRFQEAVTESKQALHRASVAEQAAVKAADDLENEKRAKSVALKRAEDAQILEARANEQTERADKLDAALATAKQKLAAEQAAHKATKGTLAALEQTHREASERFEAATVALAAVKQIRKSVTALSGLKLV